MKELILSILFFTIIVVCTIIHFVTYKFGFTISSCKIRKFTALILSLCYFISFFITTNVFFIFNGILWLITTILYYYFLKVLKFYEKQDREEVLRSNKMEIIDVEYKELDND